MVRARALGTPLSFDDLMRSAVPAPRDVPTRNSRREVRGDGSRWGKSASEGSGRGEGYGQCRGALGPAGKMGRGS